MRRLIVIASALLLLTLLGIAWWESRAIKPVALTPTLTGQVEYCLSCHGNLPEISKSHPVKTFGCVICHGGERLALDATLAHSTMRGGKNPADFSVVQASCGGTNCHSGSAQSYNDHIQRATTSIQATYAGAIARIRYTFGAQPDLTARLGAIAVQDSQSTSGITSLTLFDPLTETNPAVRAFGQNCLPCHLSAQPMQTGGQYDRFTGCAACHTPLFDSPPIFGENGGSQMGVHKLTTAISYTQCDTCHNRGNYDLKTMTLQARQDTPTDRLHDYYQSIAQFTKCEYTLDCIDCHTRTEVMGDGSLYSNKKQIQYIQCKTCHGTLTELPQTLILTDPNDIAFRQALLNPVIGLKLGDKVLVTEKGEPLWNTRFLQGGTYELVGKATGQIFKFKPVMGSGCTQDPTDQTSASCHKCHSVQR
jgi:Cytochrome c554 and c-prime